MPHPTTKLALGTWFYKYLLGPDQKPAGLPNELLSRAPQALLLMDEIHVDRFAFEAEGFAANDLGFTTSKIFMDRESKGVLKPSNFGQKIRPLAGAISRDQRQRLVKAQEAAMHRLARVGWRNMDPRWPETPFGNFDDVSGPPLESHRAARHPAPRMKPRSASPS